MMVVLLLLLSIIAIAAGMFGFGLGIPVKDTTFGAAVVVSASLAITGGFILLGLTVAVAELRRVLQAGMRQMRAERFETGGLDARRREPRLTVPGAGGGTPSGGTPGGTSGGSRGEVSAHVIPTRFDTADQVEPPRKPAGEEKRGVPDPLNARASPSPAFQAAAANGADRTPSIQAPAVSPPERLDTIRPSDHRPAEMTETSPPAEAPPSAGAGPGEEKSPPESPAEAALPGAVRPVRILKSGVINEVTYTLFSDGTIETQTPKGTQHFGSIDEFRRHLENGA
jgi:hypothetical protein